MPKSKHNTKKLGAIPQKVVKKVERELKAEDSDTKAMARNIARSLGTLGGNLLGGPIGGKIGGDAAEWLTKITGFGDYKVEGNALMKEQIPSFMSSEDGITITHKEYLRDVYGSTVFSNILGGSTSTTPFSGLINPGNSFLFPWLNTIAQSFEMYQFLGLIFEFKSTSADALNSTNTALGTVIMTTTYDVLDSNFTSKQQAEAYEFTCSTKPSESIIHPVECKPGRNVLERYYVTGIESVNVLNGDPRIYYMGNFQFMTQGMQAIADIGELWVSYKVKLIRPKIPTPLNSNLPYFHGIAGTINTGWTTMSTRPGSSLTINFVNGPNGYMFFPAVGRYWITINCGSVNAYTAATTWSLGGSAVSPLIVCDGASGTPDVASLSVTLPMSAGSSYSSRNIAQIVVDIVNISTDYVIFPQWNNTTTYNCDVVVFPISSGFTSRNPFGEYVKRLVMDQFIELRRTETGSANQDNVSTHSDLIRLKGDYYNVSEPDVNGQPKVDVNSIQSSRDNNNHSIEPVNNTAQLSLRDNLGVKPKAPYR